MNKKLKIERVNKEIDRFKEVAIVLESENMDIDNILTILKAHLIAKFGHA